MPSASPSPVKRASTERTSSATLLSSSNKASAIQHKSPRPHVVTRHSRNVSHGKNLSKLNRVQSAANVTSEDKHHVRKRSGPITPQRSPTSPGIGPGPGPGQGPPKRNTSYGALARNNTSHTNLRKNQSASALSRNAMLHGGHKKPGLAPAPRPKHDNSKTGFFELGGPQSSDDEEENEWEDSTTLSPELTRPNSKASTPKQRLTPEAERAPSSSKQHTTKTSNLRLGLDRPASPPSPDLGANNTNNRSLPDLTRKADLSPGHTTPPDPALLHHNGRAGRAPPAMSTISAVAAPNLLRRESSKSFTHINHADAASMHAAEGSSSMENGVSRFLHQTPSSGSKTPAASLPHIDSGSDGESAAFLSNYKPQPSESPEKAHTFNKARFSTAPSRTQQKLELQRRETMRQGSATPPASTLAYGGSSSLSLHGHTSSRGRGAGAGAGAPRSLTDGLKADKMNYETGVKHLLVVRRFRNPILESLQRLKDDGTINSTDPAGTPITTTTTTTTTTTITSSTSNNKNRPPSRRGLHQYHQLLQDHHARANGRAASISPATAAATAALGRPLPTESKKPTLSLAPRSSTSTRGAASAGAGVRFQVPSSDPPDSDIDIGITPTTPAAHDSPDGLMISGEFDDGMSPYEALMRRLWNSREVFDPGEVVIAR